jgi:aminomethyltransferase
MKQTSLHAAHLELNARMVPFAGWEMPIQYSNLKQEVLAVRNEVGVFDVSHMGEIFVKGPEASLFVDQLITNDFQNVEDGKAVYSPLCRENGTIIDDLISYKITNEFVLICINASNIEKDINWIQKKHKELGFNCDLINKSEDYSLLAIQGPKAFKVLRKMSLTSQLVDAAYYSVQVLEDGDTPVIAARTGYTGEDGFEIFAKHDQIQDLWSQLINVGVTPCGLGARDVLRLEVCYPLYGNELNDEVTPLDSALKWTVKLNKNSFIGKETLESYEAQYQLIKLTLDKGIPRTGYKIIQNDEMIGEVTSGTMSVVLSKGIALARVSKKSYQKDQEVFVDIRGKYYSANKETKPFVSGGHK